MNDVDEARRMGQEAWSDVASRDAGRKVVYPFRPRKIMEAYLWREPEGCFVAEKDGRVVGAAYSHVWGRIGWVGPFEVAPAHQNLGIGKGLLAECETFLKRSGCEIIGLETMPHIPKNLHFYISQGYRPDILTLIVERVLGAREEVNENREIAVREATAGDLAVVLGAVKRIGAKIFPGLDQSAEVEMTVHRDLGKVLLWEANDVIIGVVVVHTYHRLEEGDYSSLRLLIVDPNRMDGRDGFHGLLKEAERISRDSGKKRMFARFPVRTPSTYEEMLGSSYSIKGANIRLIKDGEYLEQGKYLLFSWAG